MGRELKRVPLDFDHPLKTVWSGYLPGADVDGEECPRCRGRGRTTAALRLADLVGLLLLSSHDGLRGDCHPYFRKTPMYYTQGEVVSKDILALTAGLAGREADVTFGHDAIDQWEAQRKIIAAAGLPETWGWCTLCAGKGRVWSSAALQQAHDVWQRTEPPTGPGYQIWETVSDGSPITPVFLTPDGLAKHMVEKEGGTYQGWLQFIEGTGWQPTAVFKI